MRSDDRKRDAVLKKYEDNARVYGPLLSQYPYLAPLVASKFGSLEVAMQAAQDAPLHIEGAAEAHKAIQSDPTAALNAIRAVCSTSTRLPYPPMSCTRRANIKYVVRPVNLSYSVTVTNGSVFCAVLMPGAVAGADMNDGGQGNLTPLVTATTSTSSNDQTAWSNAFYRMPNASPSPFAGVPTLTRSGTVYAYNVRQAEAFFRVEHTDSLKSLPSIRTWHATRASADEHPESDNHTANADSFYEHPSQTAPTETLFWGTPGTLIPHASARRQQLAHLCAMPYAPGAREDYFRGYTGAFTDINVFRTLVATNNLPYVEVRNDTGATISVDITVKMSIAIPVRGQEAAWLNTQDELDFPVDNSKARAIPLAGAGSSMAQISGQRVSHLPQDASPELKLMVATVAAHQAAVDHEVQSSTRHTPTPALHTSSPNDTVAKASAGSFWGKIGAWFSKAETAVVKALPTIIKAGETALKVGEAVAKLRGA